MFNTQIEWNCILVKIKKPSNERRRIKCTNYSFVVSSPVGFWSIYKKRKKRASSVAKKEKKKSEGEKRERASEREKTAINSNQMATCLIFMFNKCGIWPEIYRDKRKSQASSN